MIIEEGTYVKKAEQVIKQLSQNTDMVVYYTGSYHNDIVFYNLPKGRDDVFYAIFCCRNDFYFLHAAESKDKCEDSVSWR